MSKYCQALFMLLGLFSFQAFAGEEAVVSLFDGTPEAQAPKEEKQEEEGAILTRKFLAESGLTPEAVDRICFLVGHHHTTEDVQGMDWQILLEADYIVNAGESHFAREDMEEFVSRVLKPQASKQLMRDIYGV